MKGYKAFDADFKCRGKQYEPGKNYEEDSAEMCKSGMHFCEQPLAVLSYYPAIDKNGNPTRFAKVEAEDAQADADNQKFVTKKLKIGAEIKLGALIDAQVQFVREKAEKEKTAASDIPAETAKLKTVFGMRNYCRSLIKTLYKCFIGR